MNIEKIRRDTPGTKNKLHFNNAGAALPPRPVLKKMIDVLRLESEIGGYEAMDLLRAEAEGFYPVLAKFINCGAHNIAFAHSATDAFNSALSAIPFEPGDTILTTVNDYASNHIAFLILQKRLKINVLHADDLPNHAGVDVEDLEKKIKKHRPKLVAVTHVPTSSGLVQPVEKIGKICRRENVWYLVDGCQSAGQIPLDMKKMGCDFYSTAGRKWLRGPRTSGFLFVSDRVLAAGLEPMFMDTFGANWLGDGYEPRPDARRFEQFENALALVLGLKTAVEYAQKIGIKNIEKRVCELANYTRERLAGLKNCRVLDFGERLCGIVTCHFSGENPTEIMDFLQKNNLNCRVAPRYSATLDFEKKGVEWILRISPHYYNTIEEIDFLIEKLSER